MVGGHGSSRQVDVGASMISYITSPSVRCAHTRDLLFAHCARTCSSGVNEWNETGRGDKPDVRTDRSDTHTLSSAHPQDDLSSQPVC
jgi:hypothetical protein